MPFDLHQVFYFSYQDFELNFLLQFVNFTAIMSKTTTTAEKAKDFAAALINASMAADELGIMR